MKKALILLLPVWLAASTADYSAARRKLDLIEQDRAAPGSRVVLTAGELNAYAEQEVATAFPQGVRQPHLELTTQGATGSALIDFGKLRRAQGEHPGFLLSRLLNGERPVKVTASVRSAKGQATVDVQRVEIGGMAIDGAMLDFLIRYFLLPMYPDAVVGRPFAMGHRIDRLEVAPNAVGIVIAR